MRQPDLFAPAPARVVMDGPALRDKGHQRVVSAVSERVSAFVRDLLDKLCEQRATVTSDDLHARLVGLSLLDPIWIEIDAHPNIIGATIRAAAVAGKLRDTGRCIKTQRVAGQGRKITVWEVVR